MAKVDYDHFRLISDKLSRLAISIIEIEVEFFGHSDLYFDNELASILKRLVTCQVHLISLSDAVSDTLKDMLNNRGGNVIN